MKQIILWLNGETWILHALLILLSGFIFYYVESKICKWLFKRLRKTKAFWDDALVSALRKPLGVLIILIAILFAIKIVSIHTDFSEISDFVTSARNFIILLGLIWFLMSFISRAAKQFIDSRKKALIDETLVHAICQLFRVSIIIITILIMLQMLGIPISGILAFGGFGGLIVGWAARDMLANFFGGMMIYLDRPFSVGDWIKSTEKNFEGTVEYIGWRLTRIRTFDKRLLFIPNGIFSKIAIENPSRMTNRRIKTIINLRYNDADKIVGILKDIESMLRSHRDIDTDQTLMVNLVECAKWSLNFMIYAFTKTTKWIEFQSIQQDVFMKVLDIVKQHEAECAFPTSTMYVSGGINVYEDESK